MHSAFLFPGQGSQYLGMGKNLYASSKINQNYYHIASNILGFNLEEVSFNSSEETLKNTQYTQPAIFVHSIIIDSILKSKGIHPQAVAGHSLGEFSALVSANVIRFEDALKIIKIRSQEMANANKINTGMMAAIIGANKSQISLICNQNGIVTPANINAPNQVVISGEKQAINDAIKTANDIGIRRTIKLNVSGAFHSPLMSSARKPLMKIIKSIPFKKSNLPVYQNITAEPTYDPEIIKNNIINQLENPVLWLKTITNMKKAGISNFFEVGPGKILQGLNKKIFPESTTIISENIENINTFELS